MGSGSEHVAQNIGTLVDQRLRRFDYCMNNATLDDTHATIVNARGDEITSI